MGLLALIRDFAPAIAWSVAAAGWFVSGRQANRRERRKEIRDEIGGISKDLDDIVAYVKAALAIDQREARQMPYIDIVALLQNVDQKLERLHSRRYRHSSQIYINASRSAFEDFFDITSGDKALNPSGSQDDNHATLLECHRLARLVANENHRLFICEFDS